MNSIMCKLGKVKNANTEEIHIFAFNLSTCNIFQIFLLGMQKKAFYLELQDCKYMTYLITFELQFLMCKVSQNANEDENPSFCGTK